MRKYRFNTWKEAEEAERSAADTVTILSQAFNDLLNNDVHTVIRKGPWIARLLRPGSASGGLVAVSWNGHGSVYRVDDWAEAQRQRLCHIGLADKEDQQMAELITAVLLARNTAAVALT